MKYIVTQMAKLALVSLLVILASSFTCDATVYMVGDSSGWDISSNLDSWAQDKRFVVGDVLVFQYSSYNSVDEIGKEGFDNCNMTKVIKTFDNGNTTIPLRSPGTRYFVCGNRLLCLGGMKLQVNVEGNQTSPPVGSPQAQPRTGDTVKQPASKSNNPVIPTSAGFVHGGWDSLLMAFLSFVATTMLVVVQI